MTPTRYFITRIALAFGISRRNQRMSDAAFETHLLREAEQILDHPMHSEIFEIPDRAAEILDSDRKILAIGTTVTRTIEYYARTGKTYGECDLFLNPHNPPRRVNHLLTNFHLPKSTLIMLVSAFVGREKTLALYQEAIEKQYRFFSYGDAMLIL